MIDLAVELYDSDTILKRFIDTSRIAGMEAFTRRIYYILGLIVGWSSWKDERIKIALLYSPLI